MSNKTTLQEKMYRDIQDKSLFEQALRHGQEYLETAFERHVFPSEAALRNLSQFDEDMPSGPTPVHSVIDSLHRLGSPATVTIIGGRYFGFVNGSAVPAGLAAKQLGTFWDQNTAMQVISPIASKLEAVVEKWLRQIFELPENTVAGFVSGTSAANFCGLAAGRYRLLQRQGWDINEQGLFGAPKIRIVAGREAHSTVLKAISMLGLGKGNIEWAETDKQGRIIPETMPELDDRTLVILQAGNVNSGSFDPIEAICRQAKTANAWVHIDGAFGLWAAAVGALKHLTKGMENASSWAVDGHKTLNTPYDCGIVMCADKEAIVSALHMTGGYIVLGEERDGMFYTPDMSRRGRAVELWATMKYLGRAGIEEMVFGLHQRALQFAEGIRKVAGFEVLNEVVFNQVVVCCKSDELTNRAIAEIQSLRDCWVGGSTWQGRKVIRVSVCSWATTVADIERSVGSFAKALKTVTESSATEVG